MTAITDVPKASTAPIAQGLAAFAGVAVRRALDFVRAFKHRHDAAMLAGMDDRMLADIGLTRGDLRDAFSEPLWRDPTAVLVSRAGERRTYRRMSGGIAAVSSVIAAPSIVPAVNAGTVARRAPSGAAGLFR